MKEEERTPQRRANPKGRKDFAPELKGGAACGAKHLSAERRRRLKERYARPVSQVGPVVDLRGT